MLGSRSCSVLRTLAKPTTKCTPPIYILGPPLNLTPPPPPTFLSANSNAAAAAQFSTTASRDKQRTGKMQKVARVRVSYQNVRRTARIKQARPAPGERREKKNRIVLSNPLANDPKLPELKAKLAADVNSIGKLYYLPIEETVEPLRALGAFQRNQMWQYFPRPFTLMRRESVLFGREIAALCGKEVEPREALPLPPDVSVPKAVQRTYILDGPGGAGKSILLLQAMTWGIMNKCIVISVPNGQHITLGNTEYQPVEGSRLWLQPVYMQEMMKRIFTANKKILFEHKLKMTHNLSRQSFTKGDKTLGDLVNYGTNYESAQEAWTALLKELQMKDSVPVVLVADNVDYIMRLSEYRSPEFKHIHAFDFDIVNTLMDFFSGRRKFHRGLVLFSTTSQVHPNPSLDLSLQRRPLPQLGNYDNRVPETIGDAFKVLKIKGIHREDARVILEFCREAGLWDDSWETSMPLPSAFDRREGKREKDEKVMKERRTEALMEWFNKKVALRNADVIGEMGPGITDEKLKLPRILDRVVAEKHILAGGLPRELIKNCLRMT